MNPVPVDEPLDLHAILRAVTHDVRAALGVMVPVIDDLGSVPATDDAEAAHVRDNIGMLRRSCFRLERLAVAAELAMSADQTSSAKPPLSSVDFARVVRDVVLSQTAAIHADPPIAHLDLPARASMVVVVPWMRYVLVEAVAFVLKRRPHVMAIQLREELGTWALDIATDAPPWIAPIGTPFRHPLGLALYLSKRMGGALELQPADHLRLHLRMPQGCVPDTVGVETERAP